MSTNPTTSAGIWSAPGRANLIGEHTDYNEGFVLPFAIEHRTRVAATRRGDGIVRVTSTFDPEPIEVDLALLPTIFDTRDHGVPEWAAYPLGVAWAALRATGAKPSELSGLDLAFSSDVPIGAGLSSSAAIEGAAASALNDLWELGLDPLELAQIGRTAENDAVGAPTGIMDQIASMLGRPDAATFLDCRTLATESVDLGFDAAGLRLLVIDTHVKHSHATGGYGERIHDGRIDDDRDGPGYGADGDGRQLLPGLAALQHRAQGVHARHGERHHAVRVAHPGGPCRLAGERGYLCFAEAAPAGGPRPYPGCVCGNHRGSQFQDPEADGLGLRRAGPPNGIRAASVLCGGREDPRRR